MFPKTGNKLHDGLETEYTIAIAAALRSHLGDSHRTAKTIMRWTGASERTAKNRLGGTLGPLATSGQVHGEDAANDVRLSRWQVRSGGGRLRGRAGPTRGGLVRDELRKAPMQTAIHAGLAADTGFAEAGGIVARIDGAGGDA